MPLPFGDPGWTPPTPSYDSNFVRTESLPLKVLWGPGTITQTIWERAAPGGGFAVVLTDNTVRTSPANGTEGGTSQWNQPANDVLDDGTYRYRVKVLNQATGTYTAYTTVHQLVAVTRPGDPVITSPVAGATVANPTVVQWLAASNDKAQEAYEIQVRNMGVIEWTSGVVVSASARSVSVPFPTVGPRQVYLRVRNNGFWSNEDPGGVWTVIAVEVLPTPTASTKGSVDPFRGAAEGYDAVNLSWTAPLQDTWLGFRIVRSRSGYPLTVDDGVTSTEVTSATWYQTVGFRDTGLPGGWQYYSFFLKSSTGWTRVATTSVLIPYDYGSTDKLWDVIPEYYKHIQDDSASTSLKNTRINPALYLDHVNSAPNLLLSSFLNLFGMGLDSLRTQAEGVQSGYDVNSVHISRLGLLSTQFGNNLEQAVPAHSNRTVVRNLAHLYRERGTLNGIKDTATMVSGWDVEVTLGPNMMLSEDQAAFVNPDYPQWLPTVLYTPLAGSKPADRVKYAGYVYESLVAALGSAQAPTGTTGSNTWWSYVAYPRVDRSLARVDTGDISTWQANLSGQGFVSGSTAIGVGAPDPESPAVLQSNALQIYRLGTNGSATIDVSSVPAVLADASSRPAKQFVLESAIIMPTSTPWSSTVLYKVNDLVVYKGALYKALVDSTNVLPTVTTTWSRVGFDDRLRLLLSVYAHGPFTGATNSGGRRVLPFVNEYDETGTLIRTTSADPAKWSGQFFDSFNADSGSVSSARQSDAGLFWATGGLGSWSVARDDVGGYATPPPSGRTHQVASATAADRHVAVTYRFDPGTTRKIGVVFRRSDSSNYWIASQTGLYKVVAGAAPANPASGALTYSAFVAGDRLEVYFVGSTINVYKNGTLLGTATDAFNSTITAHGIGAEA